MTKKVIILLCVLVLVGIVAVFAFPDVKTTLQTTLQFNQTPPEPPTIEFTDKVVGQGAMVSEDGDLYLQIKYVGTLADGTSFDEQYVVNPYAGTLTDAPFVPGLKQGIVGMRVGGTRLITVPPELGYGKEGSGLVDANATLYYEVSLHQIADLDTGYVPAEYLLNPPQ